MTKPISQNHPLNYQDYTVLIVDDSPSNLNVLVAYLADYDLKVLVSRDGKSAIKRAQYAQPDIILLDVIMPGIDGFETCRRLKSNDLTQNIPIIFMTSLDTHQDKITGLKTGAVDYITKPFHKEEVLARISPHLYIKTLTQRLTQAKAEIENLSQHVKTQISQSNQKAKCDIARKMQTKGLDTAIIAEFTGLNQTELEHLNDVDVTQ